jgi:plastocyanin
MRNLRQFWLALVLVLTGMAPARGKSAEETVSVKLFQFQPDTLQVVAGTRVVWASTDEIEHTVTSGSGEQADGRFAGVLGGTGTRFTITFDRPGQYDYFCDRHHFMHGTVRVTPS